MNKHHFPYVITDSRGEAIARFIKESDRDYALDALLAAHPDYTFRPKDE